MSQSHKVAARREHSLAVFIGRFSPPHLGHLAVILQALQIAATVLIVIGSARAARRHDYVPFTAAEREAMIRAMLTPEQNERVRFFHMPDQGNIARWSGMIRAAANEIEPNNKKITLIGHSKDNSSYYLKSFPGWDSADVDNYMGLSATTFRDHFFSSEFDANDYGDFNTALDTDVQKWKEAIHPAVTDWLIDFRKNNPAYDHLVEERTKCLRDIETYGRIDPATGKKVYGPYVAADALIIQADHVLMIERGGHPYKGCLALPGGFVDPDEDVVEAAIRELMEETGLKVPELALRKAFIATSWYSAPFRDPRGRVYGASSLFFLNPSPPPSMTDADEIERYLALPRVKGADDARRAFWMPIEEALANPEKLAFDHHMQIQRALEKLPREA